jgi:hypothetical protein
MAVSWMKQGAASADLAKQEEAAQELRKSQQGKLYRWFLKDKEDAALTFVDGDLSPEGFLLPPRFYEHMVKVAGQWQTHVCPEQTNPGSGQKCPICEQGEKASLVAVLTVIDHRSFKGKDDKVYANQRRLFVCKGQTFELLNKLAIKRGGLAGCRFDVSRNGDKAPAVGNLFDFTDKQDIELLKAKYTRTYEDKDGNKHTVCDFEPANYEEEIIFRDEMELRKMGFGKGNATGGMSGFSGSAPGGNAGSKVDYSDQL